MTIPPAPFDPPSGLPITLAPGLRRILAPNPSPMTWRGTNTYLLGTRDLAVIDPGPRDTAHLKAILAALEPGQRISHILVSHSHNDHSPLSRELAAQTGAPVFAFGDATAGRSAIMTELAASGLTNRGEGIDTDFAPDCTVHDGELIYGDGWTLEVIHTPGHFGNHIALAWGKACFTGDHVMGWASSLVSPPDGDLTDFMASCDRLRATDWDIFHPGHGAPITDPAGRLDWLISHRKRREAAILQELSAGPATAQALARRIYTDIPPALLPAAERNVLAHLIDLTKKSRLTPAVSLDENTEFSLI
ncbi:MBL fold metallo-hydrolase [Pontibaca salina]|uniref:MBL fold metallo-hydrolase n=1 Tax=Pontibaca salina TaxID=2795731 RepID=A0A934HRG3_9RHOB|nr:MBL fold metallo-hydrolase [Pontibaca salina]MBI6628269.1 MBL fold metallo-hydrolase [Pontibaca salina]